MTQLEEGEYSMKDILKGAKFGDKFVCRNGDVALYLWTNNKEGYSLQLEKEKKPHHYDVDGHWYSQVDKENPYDVVSKVDDKAVLGGVLKDLQKAEKDLFDEIHSDKNIKWIWKLLHCDTNTKHLSNCVV